MGTRLRYLVGNHDQSLCESAIHGLDAECRTWQMLWCCPGRISLPTPINGTTRTLQVTSGQRQPLHMLCADGLRQDLLSELQQPGHVWTLPG